MRQSTILDVKIYGSPSAVQTVKILRILFMIIAVILVICMQVANAAPKFNYKAESTDLITQFVDFQDASSKLLDRQDILHFNIEKTPIEEECIKKEPSSCKLDALMDLQNESQKVNIATKKELQKIIPKEKIDPYAYVYEPLGLTKYEFLVICKYLSKEYGYGCLEGQAATVSVVLNRRDSDLFPNDILSIIGQENQFAEEYLQAPFIEPTDQMIEAIQIAFSGKDYSCGAVYYANLELIENPDTLEWFNSLEVSAEFPGATFYFCD